MSACEKCWADSGGDPRAYRKLLDERMCSAEEQAGQGAFKCPTCKRMTLHQYTREPMCGCEQSSDDINGTSP